MSVFEASESGSRLETLEMARGVLAKAIDECDSPRDLPSLVGRLESVLKQIEELSKGKKAASKVDELAERRKQRQRPIRDGATREA